MTSNSIISVYANSLDDFKQSFRDLCNLSGRPTLAILFVNADLEIPEINKFLIKENIDHIGASTAGEICDNHFSSGIYSALFFYIPKDSFRLINLKIDNDTGLEFGKQIRNAFQKPAVYSLIASKSIETDLLIKDIQQMTAEKISLYGGLATDNYKFEKYTVFSNDGLMHENLVAVVFDTSYIDLVGDAYSGWESLGITHTVTASNRNELLEIDGQPASEVFLGYFNYFDMDKLVRGEEVEFSVGNHPIMIEDVTGAQYIKSPVEIDLEKQSLKFYTSIAPGTKFKFCKLPDTSISEKLINRQVKLKAHYGHLDGLIVTSCVGRNLTLGPFFEDEVKAIYDIWNIPMTGFLSGGEIGNPFESGISCFHNVSSILTGFRINHGE